MKVLKLLLMLSLVTSIAHADGGYKCKVVAANDLTAKGNLSENEFNGANRILVGKEFTVDRGTGRMIGEVSNHNEWTTNIKVLDFGSSEQSYKVLSTATLLKPNTGVNVSYLYVEEFTKSKIKPFMFIDYSTILTGTCVHY